MVALGLVTTEHLEGKDQGTGLALPAGWGGGWVQSWRLTEAVGLGLPVRWHCLSLAHLLRGWRQAVITQTTDCACSPGL